jgi:uncharacterized membrane protein
MQAISTPAHMDNWNQGRRHQPTESGPSVYQQTYEAKLNTLRSLAAHIDGVSVIDEDRYRPKLRAGNIEAGLAWNDAEVVTLTLHKLTPEQAQSALTAIQEAK